MNVSRFIAQARAEALKSELCYHKVGAVLVKGNRVIGRGFNRFSGRIVWFEKKYNLNIWSLHAEMDCIDNCRQDLSGAFLFVSGLTIKGNPFNCKPCASCRKIIKHLPLAGVYYETKEGIISLEKEKL